ncbi:hypothetical protein N9A94_00490 [Akkermansiaceae bacterium]|nr:hypothetical protein [Akkermansiaceae bacterium]MDA7887899.1 hypothetical protein [Akkermansiaceae bacterium]MDB4538199.1 hypothetical protein [Akkermansiaceae bacterium]
MEAQVDPSKTASPVCFTFVRDQIPKALKYGTVTALLCGGVGLMLGGCLALGFRDNTIFFGSFVAGSVFVASGAMGFLRCLDGK